MMTASCKQETNDRQNLILMAYFKQYQAKLSKLDRLKSTTFVKMYTNDLA